MFTFLALSLLMVTAVGAISYLRARSSLQSQVFNRLQAAEQLKADSVDRWIDEQRRNAVFVGGFLGGNLSGDASGLGKAIQIVVDRRASPAARAKARLRLGTGLQYIVGQTADAQELLILDLSGRVVVSTLAAHDGRNFSKQRWFQQGSSNTYVDPISLSALADTPTMTVATPLFDRTGQRVAVLAANLNLERLDQIVLPAQGLGSTGQSYLVGSDGRFVSSTLRTGAFTGRLSSHGIAVALSQHDGRGLYRNYAGVPVIGVYDWLPELDAALVAEQSQHAAFAPARRLAFTLAGIGVVVAALLGLAIYIASRRLARPILAITETATAVAAGDLTREAPVTTRDEVGQLAIAFNAMTAQLRETLEGLEQRVAERTEELRLQNVELAALHETTLGVMHRLDPGDLLSELLSRACELLGVSDGYFYVRDPDGETLVSRVAIGVFAGEVGTRIPRGEGVAGRVWEDGAPVIIEDYDSWEGRVASFPAVGSELSSACRSVPATR